MLGNTSNMCAYKVWDVENKKNRDVSFAFSFVHEGFFAFRNWKDWPEPPEKTLIKFYPSRVSALDEREWGIFEFDLEEEEDIASQNIFYITLSECADSEYAGLEPLTARKGQKAKEKFFGPKPTPVKVVKTVSGVYNC